MARLTRARAGAALALATTLIGCARQAPIVMLTAPVEATPPRPVLPVYLGAIVPPAIGADGQYLTINHGIDALQAMWHVRAALNVAAIGCRGTDNGAAIVAAYNAMLTAQHAALAAANASVEKSFRARSGAKDWQNAHDAYMTRLYNFFAAPAAKPAFCAAAAGLATQAAALPPAQFAAFTATALPQLEAPFTDVFRQVDGYRTAVAAWDARYGPNAVRGETAQAAASPPRPNVTPVAILAPARPKLNYGDVAMLVSWQEPPVTLASR